MNVSEEPELVGALGAALLALRRLEKIREDKKTAVVRRGGKNAAS